MDDITLHRKKRLRSLIDASPYHGSQLEFARAVHLSEGRVSQLLDPKESFGERSARKIEGELRLADRYFEQPFTLVDQEHDFVFVRRADVETSGDVARLVYFEDDRPPLSFRADFLRKLGVTPSDAVVVDAKGTSNHPRIVEGSVVLLNRGDTERLNGDFFAFRYGSELQIRRLERLEDAGIVATADNADFKPKMKVYGMRDMGDFEVIGRAVWAAGTL